MICKSINSAVCTCIAIVSFNASATLIGDTITASGSSINPSSATIDSGIEFLGLYDHLAYDFGEDTLTITSGPSYTNGTSWGDFGDFVFSDFDSEIIGMSLISNLNFYGPIVDNFSFTSDSITIDMDAGAAVGYSMHLVFGIETASVPEPSIIWLLGSGLALIGFARRKA